MGWDTTLQATASGTWWVLKGLLTTLYFVTVPLHYPLYYAAVFIGFLLSPIWFLVQGAIAVSLFIGAMIAKLKYLYLYLACAAVVGILTGLIVHGTSSYLFILLGVDLSTQQRDERQLRQRQRHQGLDDLLEEPGGYKYYDETLSDPDASPSGSKTGPTSPFPVSFGRTALSSRNNRENIPPRLLQNRSGLGIDVVSKPRRRRKGLLAQTIHEESSESDFM